MKRRQLKLLRISAIHGEYLAAQSAMELLGEELRRDPNRFRDQGVSVRVARDARRNLEATFLIRLFSEFEAGLREYWRLGLGQMTIPQMKDLLLAITSRRKIPHDLLDQADAVRLYRNSLVHPARDISEAIPIAECRNHLRRFFSRLPLDWPKTDTPNP